MKSLLKIAMLAAVLVARIGFGECGPIVVPPVIASFDPFAVAIRSNINPCQAAPAPTPAPTPEPPATAPYAIDSAEPLAAAPLAVPGSCWTAFVSCLETNPGVEQCITERNACLGN